MDNNSNFEQQFTQNLNAGAPTMQPIETTTGSSKLPLIVAIALAAITLVESIVLIITLSNYFSLANDTYSEDIEEESAVDEVIVDNNYNYDDNDNLVSLNATCTNNSGATYTLKTDNSYTLSGSDSANTSGTYTVTNDSLISLSGSNKVLYYDGISLADGLTIYECEENGSE